MTWEHERANTAPDNFLFSQGRAQLRVATPGLYSLSCAVFFAHPHPTVTINVNGVEAMRRVGARRTGTTYGQAGGVSLRDFLSLPPNALITVGLDNHGGPLDDAQAFLELRKL